MLLRIDVNHFSKASFNFSYVPVSTLFLFSDEFWKPSKIFSLFFFQVATVLPGIMNWFPTSLSRLPFSSSFNASYFTFKITSWYFLFVAIFIVSATNNRIHYTNLKISKHSNFMAFKLKHSNLLQKLRNQNSNYMMKNTSRGPKNLFDLDHLSNYRSLNYMTSTVYNFV